MSLETLQRDYKHVFDRGDGSYVAIYPLMFHWTMIVGAIENEEGYDDRWCYDNEQMALDAKLEWAARGYEGEPTGWHRHPMSGRRRTNGDPAQELVAH